MNPIRFKAKKGSSGDLYEYKEGSFKLVKKDYSLTPSSTKEIKFGVICQLIAEGQSLTSILESDKEWLPSEYEFYLWVDSDKEYKMRYHKSKVLRHQGVIERMFQTIENTPQILNDEESKETIKVLNSISAALAKEVDSEDRTIVTVKTIPLKEDSTPENT